MESEMSEVRRLRIRTRWGARAQEGAPRVRREDARGESSQRSRADPRWGHAAPTCGPGGTGGCPGAERGDPLRNKHPRAERLQAAPS